MQAGRAVYRDRYDSCDSDGNIKDDDESDRCCDQVIDWYHSDGGEMEEPYTITGNSSEQRERDKKGDNTRDPDGSEPEETAAHVQNMDVAWAAITRENLKWARSVVFSRAFTLKWFPGHTIALVPLFDMLDHSPGARWECARDFRTLKFGFRFVLRWCHCLKYWLTARGLGGKRSTLAGLTLFGCGLFYDA